MQREGDLGPIRTDYELRVGYEYGCSETNNCQDDEDNLIDALSHC